MMKKSSKNYLKKLMKHQRKTLNQENYMMKNG